ncbi:hypothetical protein [Rhizobium sp. WYJ-E13]|uniref:hypothetical protein n=1 Tax=Rhizobium sp. WYJ-E13 TaxID=2849093 RepID=UPI001C1E9669|nr:hypothetical protein [Rhizobium sp. WYJ-E13]QWW69723.1 hypothetical protein KQ933_08465 [Rhizobium sp. WYJ-E13]
MDFLRDLAGWSVLAVAVLLLVVQLVAHEIGYRFGSARKPNVAGQAENVGVVVAGMLGLLAFVLALTLSYSTARFNERREGTLSEANAIGTAWLRAVAIGTPDAVKVARLLEDYLNAREAFVKAGFDSDAIASANQETSRLQQSIWAGVSAIVRERPDPVTAALMASVNEVFDTGSAERFAMGIRLPPQIFWLLAGVMLLSMASVGYQFGLRGRPVRVLILLLTIVWTAIIVNILDLASPRVGNFRTNAIVYEWTRQGFSGMAAPPATSQ